MEFERDICLGPRVIQFSRSVGKSGFEKTWKLPISTRTYPKPLSKAEIKATSCFEPATEVLAFAVELISYTL